MVLERAPDTPLAPVCAIARPAAWLPSHSPVPPKGRIAAEEKVSGTCHASLRDGLLLAHLLSFQRIRPVLVRADCATQASGLNEIPYPPARGISITSMNHPLRSRS